MRTRAAAKRRCRASLVVLHAAMRAALPFSLGSASFGRSPAGRDGIIRYTDSAPAHVIRTSRMRARIALHTSKRLRLVWQTMMSLPMLRGSAKVRHLVDGYPGWRRGRVGYRYPGLNSVNEAYNFKYK